MHWLGVCLLTPTLLTPTLLAPGFGGEVQVQEQGACDASCQKLLQRGCDGGNPSACHDLGKILTEEPAASVPGNATRATVLLQRACDKDLAPACHSLAWQYLRETSAHRDLPRGRDLELKACKLGTSEACDDLVDLESPAASALATAAKYCDLGGERACYRAAFLLTKEYGETAEVAERIVTYGQRGCLRGNDEACNSSRHLAVDFIRWCEEGQDVRNSCAFAGFVQLSGLRMPPGAGDSIPPDPQKAEAELRRSCEAGAQAVCARLKELHRPAG